MVSAGCMQVEGQGLEHSAASLLVVAQGAAAGVDGGGEEAIAVRGSYGTKVCSCPSSVPVLACFSGRQLPC